MNAEQTIIISEAGRAGARKIYTRHRLSQSSLFNRRKVERESSLKSQIGENEHGEHLCKVTPSNGHSQGRANTEVKA